MISIPERAMDGPGAATLLTIEILGRRGLPALGGSIKLDGVQPHPDAGVPVRPFHSLQETCKGMVWSVEAGTFALVGFQGPPQPADLACLQAACAQLVRDRDETTLLVRDELAPDVLACHAGARCLRGLAWIRFESPMGWDVVGFLALVAGELAGAGIPLGAVCGFSRDHLFLAEERLPEARAVLQRLFPQRGRSPRAD